MSHESVECVIGRLVTDEGFRRHFARDPIGALATAIRSGHALTECESRALLALDSKRVARLAEAIDPRLQKVDLEGECP